MSDDLQFKVLHITWTEPQRKRGGRGLGERRSHKMFHCLDIASNCVIHITEKAYMSKISFVFLRSIFKFLICGLSPRYLVSYTKPKL